MRRQLGNSAIAAVAVLAVLVAGVAGFFAWRGNAQANFLQSELDTSRAAPAKARPDLKKAAAEAATSSKEAKDLKVVTDRLTAERDAVRTTMENEQATGVRLRAELELAKQQVSYLSARTSKDVVRGMPRAAASK